MSSFSHNFFRKISWHLYETYSEKAHVCVLTISFFCKMEKDTQIKETFISRKTKSQRMDKKHHSRFQKCARFYKQSSYPNEVCKNCIFRGVHNLSAKKALKLNIFCLFFAFFKKVSKLHVWQKKKRGKKIVTNLKSSRMKTASMFAVHIFAIIGLCLSSGLGYKYSNKEEPLRGIHSSEISMIFCLLGFT